MKVRFYQAELFIEPETEFEEEVLSKFHNCTAILKSGLSLSETKGILIRQCEKSKTDKKNVVWDCSTCQHHADFDDDCYETPESCRSYQMVKKKLP